MTRCNRCGEEFDNYFRGLNWCVSCGKLFMYDDNMTYEDNYSYVNDKEVVYSLEVEVDEK
jgi:predicted  nucleic acid-binding Zn-ribbon protein